VQVTVFGAGAIGGWLAGTLGRAGVAVSVAARGAALAALQRDGLRLIEAGRSWQCAVTAAEPAALGPADLLVVTTKAHDLPAAADALRALIGPETRVVALLNGLPWWFFQGFEGPLRDARLQTVDPGGQLAAITGSSPIIGGVVHASVEREQPGCVRVIRTDRLILGEPSGGRSPSLRWLVETLVRGGVPAEVSGDIRRDIWLKLWGNMNMNPLSALTRATTDRLLDDPEVRALCLQMMMEMAACGDRLGLHLGMTPATRMDVTRRLGDFKTSMLQDLEQGRRLEYEPQLGAIVEVAHRLAVPAPFCEAVLGLIRQLST
jgi:2-dehydropantoate 2-reductase